jgi:hypothetical protein
MKKIVSILLLLIVCINTNAQDSVYTRNVIKTLCSEAFAGRGYVNNGMNKAADFLANEFKTIGLKSMSKNYFQHYTYPINTFPKDITCTSDKRNYDEGIDYLIEANSKKCKGTYSIKYIHANDSALAEREISKLVNNKQEALCFLNNENRAWSKLYSSRLIDNNIYPNLIINTTSKKLTHDLSTELGNNCMLLVKDSLFENNKKIEINATNQFVNNYKAKNIIGFIEGKIPDSFMVYSTHYDHLGMLGNAIFPGASDNASGVSMLLNLAKHYKTHQPKYTTYFILFSGEEAGLIGSKYYTENPLFPLENIRFLLNIDIMGNAEKGITVVNGSVFEKEFNLMKNINDEKRYLPEVRIRGKAANSDHYFFTEKGVPSIFIYTMGGQGYYHDVDDTAENVLLTNYENVFKLFVDFTDAL